MSEGKSLAMPSPYARPHINVTPLIDVLLVLLIIFMVASHLHGRVASEAIEVPDQDCFEAGPDSEC